MACTIAENPERWTYLSNDIASNDSERFSAEFCSWDEVIGREVSLKTNLLTFVSPASKGDDSACDNSERFGAEFCSWDEVIGREGVIEGRFSTKLQRI